jgi:outer membrane cobalamin receptor
MTRLPVLFLFSIICNIAMGQTDGVASDALETVTVRGSIVSDASTANAVFRRSLNADQIVELNTPDVASLLRALPGIDVARQGGSGGLVYVSIRGGDPNFTVVIIDGVQVDDPTNSRGGGYDFSGLDPLMIEQIDVFYGSFSAIFGSSALGGVISVTTKGAATGTSLNGTIELGTNKARAGAVTLSGEWGELVDIGVSASVRDGNEAVEGNSLDRKQLALHIGRSQKVDSDFFWQVNLFASDSDSTTFPTASGGPKLAVIRDTESRNSEQRNVGTKLSWIPEGIWQVELSANASRYREDNFSPAIVPAVLSGVPPVETHSEYKRSNISWLNSVYPGENLALGFGAELINEKGEIDSIIDFGFPLPANFNLERDTWAVFGEASYSDSFYTLLASIRHDEIEHIDSTNIRLATEFDFQAHRTKVWLSYAEGFKMPSMFALGHSLTGNPQLEPEQSKSYSGTLEKTFPQQAASISLTFFKNSFKNIVDFDANTFLHVNRAQAQSKGVELSGQVDLTTTLSMNTLIGYLNTRISDGSKMEHRPNWKGRVALNWRPRQELLVSVSGDGNDGAYSVSVPTGLTSLDGYFRVNAGLQWQFNDKLAIKFQLDNLFDSDYEEVIGFLNGGRQARISLTASL